MFDYTTVLRRQLRSTTITTRRFTRASKRGVYYVIATTCAFFFIKYLFLFLSRYTFFFLDSWAIFFSYFLLLPILCNISVIEYEKLQKIVQ